MKMVHPQAPLAAINTAQTLTWIGRKHNLPPSLMNPEAKINQTLQQAGQVMGQQMAQGADPAKVMGAGGV